ncbi:glycosyltransferase family 4 protein [Spirosoma rhododendri]|uniref:Glycosyltransferase family 4 protein n=1 Tax=Spirosoma rhododendri TaxID=2728024 RepID=A0A7L5DIV6_9BACT|nr:glycosyltransferase family 4 protein [Spirosoma rhododendri]QJD77341.1 glycosyltransferase family 4 protein [Spirosoma rhododendri]
MTILYLTYYFHPDLSAGSFRNTPFVDELARQLSPADTIHVITTQPNRYRSFSVAAPAQEDRSPATGARVWVERVQVPAHTGSMRSQVRAFVAYYRAVCRLTRDHHYDRVMVSSSRLFTAFLGSMVARRQRAELSLDIRDLFRESILDVLPHPLIRLLLNPVLTRIERYTFGRAKHINLVSKGFKPYFDRFPRVSYSYFTNGIDTEFLSAVSDASNPLPENKPRTLLYAGNIGEGQGLHIILPEAARLLGNGYRFIVIGDGAGRRKLEAAIRVAGVTNIDLHAPVSRHELLDAYAQADYLFVHLNDLNAFRRVLPSKLFEYGATDKPIVAGVAGYAAQFIREHLTNTLLFAPGDAAGLVQQLQQTRYQRLTRPQFVDRFQRQTIMADMARHWLASASVLQPVPTDV